MMRSHRVQIAVLVLVYSVAAATAPASTTFGDLQSHQIHALKDAAEWYKAEYGAYPATDADSTWFEKLVDEWVMDESWLKPRKGGFGTTPDGALPLDVYGNPIIYELHPGLPGGAAVFRAVGRNGLDDNGALDDFDSRYGPNLGYWNKAAWPAFYRWTVICALISVVGSLFILRYVRSRRFAVALMALFLGFVSGLLWPGPFCIFPWDTSATRMPHWPEPIALTGCWTTILAVVLLAVLAVHALIRRNRIVRAVRANRCVSCGYDMRGSPTSICPECGTDQKAAGCS